MKDDAAPRGAMPSVHLALALVQIFFGANAVFGKLALRSVSTYAILGVRVLGAALVFYVVRVLRARRQGWEKLAPRDLPLLVGAALLGVTFNQLLFYEGLDRTSATNAGVLMATIPVLTIGFLLALGRERPTTRRLLGLVAGLGGALTVACFGRPGTLHLQLGRGELCIIANSACYALYLVVSRPLFQRYRTDTVVTWIFAVGALTLGLPCLGACVHDLPRAPPLALASVAYVLFFPTIGAYFLNGYALRRAPSSLAAIYIFAQPLVAATLAAIILGERLVPATVVGGCLIGLGIALASLDSRDHRDS